MSSPTLPAAEPGGDLQIGALYSETLKDLVDNFAGYALATLGLLAIAFPLGMIVGVLGTVGMNIVILLGVFGSAGIASAIDDRDVADLVTVLGSVGSIGVAAVLFTGVLLLVSTVVAPVTASLYRAIAAHQRGEAPLGFNAAFSTVREGAGRSVLVTLLATGANMLGMMFCYVGALVPAALFGFASVMVALHRRGALDALSRAARHAMAHPGPHFLFAVAFFATAMVASQIPVLGHAFLLALLVRAYRKMFGDALEPAV